MKIIKILVCFLIITSCSSEKKQNLPIANTSKPNVILIITDDQGYGDVGAHGNKIIKTPNIDNFHKESYHLTNFHVGPTCAPTRSGLMTGRYANSTGVWHTVGGWSLLRENEKTIANMFTEAGYKTGGFGKWHLGDNYPFRPEHRGFQETVMHGGGGVQQTPDYWNNTYFNDTYFHNGKPQKYQGYCTDVFFNEALNFIETNKNQPFFCYIAPNAPHGPYNVPLEYYNLYKDLGEDVLADTQKRFYGMITNIDDNFGKLRKKLKELNVADNTILIFMTDNGTSAGYYNKNGKTTGFNANMRGTKGSEYDGGHRVPFFIHWKNGNISTSKDFSTLTAQLDIMPTLAEMCGIDLPKNHLPIDGQSLVPLLREKDSLKNRMLVTDSQRVQHPEKWKNSAVMQDHWRLINGKELYNVSTDQGQQNNISAEFPKKVNEMKAFYENWWTQVSKDFDKEIYFKIGSEHENPITLTAHDIHAESGAYPWNQIYVREGITAHGYWSVDILKSGNYEVSLRRYPKESNLAINATTPVITKEDLPGLENDIPKGKNLNFVKASIEFENQIKSEISIQENDFEAKFNVNLKAGKTKFEAKFSTSDDNSNVAYYAYIKKI
ncbi:arylsulfatase [Formosa agariphila KMM 3901]|uniref:Arylsulfatase n=1 Tax=Formosa agariphila (strain DSM 15362 / KCTC 12365 / LMG 23005 / KMM 3901 / M-2Alg 35-1) TaxID=1347342 RepID=T2KM76_FORAG|nr:arylsulfatase [Formosa agariphila]CDF79805.1 arylsulfatase [Formosa agariphila KMM 3901]